MEELQRCGLCEQLDPQGPCEEGEEHEFEPVPVCSRCRYYVDECVCHDQD